MSKADSGVFYILLGVFALLWASFVANLALIKRVERLEAEKRILLELYGDQLINLPLLPGEKEILNKATKKMK